MPLAAIQRAGAILVAGGVVAGCAGATGQGTAGAHPVRLRALDFSAGLEVGESAPQELAGEVRITNRGSTPETLVFQDGCPVRLRVYDVDGSRVAPVWEGPRRCSEAGSTLAIAPGETEVLSIPRAAASEILAGGLAGGDYRVTVWLSPGDRVVEIEAGIVELTPS